MSDIRLMGLATAVTILAIADSLLPTPEDYYPFLGWIDEAILWGLAARLWKDVAMGKTLEEVFSWEQ